MSNVIFARTRYEYPSYSDFWRLVELADYPTCYVGEIDPQSDNTYIVTPLNGEWQGGWQNPRARIILWDLEWRDEKPRIPGVSEIFTSDAWYANRMGFRYVPLGSHPGLKLRPDSPNGRLHDTATLWYVTGRRGQVLADFARYGVTTAPPSDLWGENRHNVLMQSRSMVHVHQRDDAFTVAPQRFALAAAYSLPLITETLTDCGVFTQSYRLMSDIRHMGEFTRMWLQPHNTQRLEDFGHALHQLLCVDHTFRKVIESSI